jgi:tetratricopeptide (TPR) repeat protein
MKQYKNRWAAVLTALAFCLGAGLGPIAQAQSPDNRSQEGQSSSSSTYSSSSSSSAQAEGPPEFKQAQTPTTLVDPAGPTISLIHSEPVFFMGAALNACGYDEGLNESDPIRKWVRDQMTAALAKSEDARARRDSMCLFIAQHNLTGTDEDRAQYISLALYLTQPPNLEITVDPNDLPPDATQVTGVVPLVKDFAQAVDLNGIWLVARRSYDHEIDIMHDPLSNMIVKTDTYLKMPAEAYTGRRFIVVLEPMFSPHMVNARVYGLDYVVVVSPVNGTIPMDDVRHTYLHYVIDPLLFARYNGLQQLQPIVKTIQDAPLDFHFRSDPTLLTIECLINAIEARTMDTGIPVYQIPAGVERSQLPRYQHQLELYQQKVEAARVAAVQHDMAQGFVLTQYFYEQLLSFEKSAQSLSSAIGEMVYGMDVDQQVHRARETEFDKVADQDVLQRPVAVRLTGLDLAEEKLSQGDAATAAALAQKAIAANNGTPMAQAAAARAYFILARVALMTSKPQEAFDDFNKTVAMSKDPRILAWSHIYLGRMLDLSCRREEAVAQYKDAMANRDGALDTRVAAEHGEKAAYAVNGHTCEADADADQGVSAPAAASSAGTAAPNAAGNPQ